jgi:DNA-binding beta-propeller fold protein YncE
MKKRSSLKVCFLIVLLALIFAGCQESEKGKTGSVIKPKAKKQYVVYPGPPERPRIQFLTSFRELNLESGFKQSSFDKFLFGKPEVVQSTIVKPYGVAIFEGKIYVCDVGSHAVKIIDLKTGTVNVLTKDIRLLNPVNIFIEENRTKYVTDTESKAVYVFNSNNTLTAILGKDLNMKPVDVAVHGERCYITDMENNQIVVLNKKSGQEIMRIGKSGTEHGQFNLISDLVIDPEGNIYVTDKALGKISIFNSDGIFQKTIGESGSNVGLFARPKGIDLDKEGRIWVVDAATAVGKLYTTEPQLLLYFGHGTSGKGIMDMPATIIVDYDNTEYFEDYVMEGEKLEFLILVANQFGPSKISIYGFLEQE